MKDRQQSFFTFSHLLRLYQTVKHLKKKQIFYRLYYPIKRIVYRPSAPTERHIFTAGAHGQFNFPSYSSDRNLYHPGRGSFTFLNRTHVFGPEIDWHYGAMGLLWNFHLHYFDWLNDKDLSPEICLHTIDQYIDYKQKGKTFNHSYPASLRIVNWIKFLLELNIVNNKIIKYLYDDCSRLLAFPEYPLMGNHLLQNGIALVWAGVYFGEPKFYVAGERILLRELDEQVLDDGAHFEKSVAYHAFLLKSLLDLYRLLGYKNKDNLLFSRLNCKCSEMLSYLFVLVYGEEIFPHFGDSSPGMTISFREIVNVAQSLRVNNTGVKLRQSGLRKIEGEHYRLFFHSGNVPASYQPGHSHADAFTFCLVVRGKQVIVDPGTSTYERSARRLTERSTAMHNTICVGGENSSDVWASFRIGKRARVVAEEDSDYRFRFRHDGYRNKFGITHVRMIRGEEGYIEITDELSGWKGQKASLYIHFHPGIHIVREGNVFKIDEVGMAIEVGSEVVYMEEYAYCAGWNQTQKASRIVAVIGQSVTETRIKIENGKTN